VIPALVIRVELEAGTASVHVLAESYEDEQALRAWLRTRAFRRLLVPAIRSIVGRSARA
jgi:quinol monooxygenase YgiN